jgi:competence protein ComEC
MGDRFPGCLFAALCGTASAALFFLCILRGPLRTLILTVISFILLGYYALQPWVAPELPPTDIKFSADGPRCLITGRVAGCLEQYGARTRFLLDVNALDQQLATGKLRVTVVGGVPEITIGDTVQFKARVKSIRNFNNPGAFDYRRYLAFKRVWASAWVPGKRVRVLERSHAFSFKKRLGQLRSTLSKWITGTLDTREGSIITALVTGDRSGISPELREQFNRLGIGHLLAISGLHIGIIAAVSFWGFNLLCRRVDFLLNPGLSRRTAALLAIFPVTAYGLIAGMSPSTQRAVIMVTVYLFTIILDREHDPINTLAAAALIIIVLHPPALFSVSFQLSFAAVFIILYGLSCLPERWLKPLGRSEKVWSPARLVGKFTTFFWVSFFAIAGTLPFSMHYFNQVSYIGILTNFIYIPVVGFVTVPLALTATVLFPVSSTVARWFLKAAETPLAAVMELADRLSGFTWISGHTVTLNWFEMICFFSLMVIVLQLIKPAGESTGSSNGQTGYAQTGRTKRIVWKWLVPAVLILTVDVVYWMNHRVWHRDLRVTCLDVRQGSSALLEFPGGKTMLIDGGGYSDNSIFDMGARVVAPFLWNSKILTVDTLVLTHPNSDHLNGLLYIAEKFNVGEIWTNAETADTTGYRKLMQIVGEGNIKHPAYKALPRVSKIGGVTVSLLYPPEDFLSRKRTESWRKSNNNSVVLKTEFDGVTFLFTGDIMARAEKELVRVAGEDLKSTVLFVPHHGSNSSSSAIFLRYVEPTAAIISAGRGNRYKFPHPAVLERYQAVGCNVYRTDQQGAIRVIAGDGAFMVYTMTDS